MNGLSFLVTDLEISFEDASLRCGIVWLVGLFSVCGIPYCSPPTLPTLPTLPISYFLSSTHTHWPPLLPRLPAAHLLGQGTHALTHPGPDAKTSAAPCQWSKYFQRGARTLGAAEGDETRLGSCVDCQRTNGSQTHPYGCPVSQPRRRLKGHGPRQNMWCLTGAT